MTSTAPPDGDEALLLAEERTPDLVILDWMIEGVSGIEVCRRLRRKASTAHVPIIMLTARGEESGPHPRTRDRRGRLCHQAVQPARAARASRRGAASCAARAGGRAACLMREIEMDVTAHRVRRGASRCSSVRPNSACFAIFWSIPAESSRANGCSTRSGRTIPISMRGRSTCTCGVCAGRLNEGGQPDVIRTVRSAGYSLDADS